MLTASDSEKCASCGRGYRIIYRVPDDIWARIAPDKDSLGDHPEHQGGGLLCPLCADERARELGIRLVFDADVDWRSDVVVVPDREDEPTIPAGMKPWHGGPKPADWSGEAVQFRSGKVMHAPIGAVWKLGWDHSYGDGDIIAYTPKPTPTDTADRVGFHSAGEG